VILRDKLLHPLVFFCLNLKVYLNVDQIHVASPIKKELIFILDFDVANFYSHRTLPKSCLTKSAFLTPLLFQKMLGSEGVGFEIKSTKDSPKVSFFILQRPVEEEHTRSATRLNPTFTQRIIRNKGKKFPNQFSVVLQVEHVFGTGTLEGGIKQNANDKK